MVNANVDPELVDEGNCGTVVLSDRPGVVAVGLQSTSNNGEQRASSSLSLVPQLAFSNSSLIHSQKCNFEYGLSKSDLYFSSVNGVLLPGKVCTTDISAYKTT